MTAQGTTLPARFAAQAAATPDAVAVTSGATRLTYRELDRRSDALAWRLLRRDVRPGQTVAVLMERTPDLAVALLGVVKAGAAFLPLHSTYPVERIEWILADASCPVLLVDAATRDRGLPAGPQAVVVDDGRPDIDGDDGGGPVPACVGPGDLAYVMYTSGSTGHPKGVMVDHRAALELMLDPCWDSGHHRRVLMIAPYAFGVSDYELWVPLLHGGEVVMAPPGKLDVETVRTLVRVHAITGLHLTAGLFRVIADEAPDAIAGVREVLTGGDVITPAAVSRVLAACPDLVVRAMYGATESVLFATHHPMTAATYVAARTVPVGRPVRGARVYLLDERGQLVPPGSEGEIHIGGTRLALGYLGRPELTEERFVTDPFAGPGARMYRTGDLGRWTPDGLLDFVGRADDQIKVRGFRVEPAEVEYALRGGVPGLADVAVVAQATPEGARRLVAYLVPEAGADVNPGAVRRHAADLLPDHMVPEAVVVIAALPLTANGKLDRRALPAPDGPDRADHRVPRTDSERLVCRLFGEVLGMAPVGLDDDFFALGGQSLLAMRLMTQISNERGITLPVITLFDASTAEQLAAELDARFDTAA